MDINKFCSLPFRGLQIWTNGTLKPCCMYQQEHETDKTYHVSEFDTWWNSGLSDIRNQFAHEQIPSGCRLCFHPEFINSGVRVNTNNWMINNVPNLTVTNTPEHIDITFGNICNLKCLMCSSLSSSRIETEYKLHQTKFNSIGIVQPTMPKLQKWWEDPETLDKVITIVKNARYINFSGGEPLITPQLIDILKAIPSTCQVEINTNLTKLTDEHIECLSKFNMARISISLDGIGAHHEYIRYESSWTDIEENINKLFRANLKNLEIAFSFVLQHTSIYTFPSFWNYFKDYSNNIRMSEVIPNTHKDNMMTINSAVPDDVAKFQEWHQSNPTKYDHIIRAWLANYKFDPNAFKDFKDYIEVIDNVRSCNFRSTFNPTW